MSNTILELKNIVKSFGKGDAKVEVLKGIDLHLAPGETIAVLGASGAGKSTLLHIMGGLERPTAGGVLYQGEEIYAMGDAPLADFRNRELGFVFQSHHLLPEFTALENVMLPMLISKKSREAAEWEARELLKSVGLSTRERHKPGELSGGEQQRVAVARALVRRPKMLLADEPTGNLDSRTGDETFGLMMDLNREFQITFVMVTHNETLAARMGRQIVVRDGRTTD